MVIFVDAAWANMSQARSSKAYLSNQVPESATISHDVDEEVSVKASKNHDCILVDSHSVLERSLSNSHLTKAYLPVSLILLVKIS